MSALESLIATSGESPLQVELDYSLAPASTAIVDRRTCLRAYPTSASSLSPTTTRTCRLRLGGDDMLDASSVRLQFTITNNDASKPLVPTTGAWGVWSQVFLRSGGTELDSVPYYGRHHTQFMFNQLTQAEQFGPVAIQGGLSTQQANAGLSFRPLPGTIAGGKSLTVMHSLALSMFTSGKILPTRYAPLELELNLVNNVSDWLSVSTDNSSAFTISDIQLLYSGVVLDEAIYSSFYKALMNNRLLSLPVMNCYQFTQQIPSGATTFSFSSVRAFSRLCQVWVSFRKDGARNSSFVCPGNLPGGATGTELENGTCPTARLSLGPHCWPAPAPVSSVAEYYHMFHQALGFTPNITRWDYENNSFAICFDLKRNPTDSTTAVSSRSGDLIRVDLTNMVADAATEVFVTLVTFNVVAVRESGVTLLN